MASSAKDIQLRERKDTITQLKTMISEQTELISSLRLVIDEKTSHEKALQDNSTFLMKRKWNKILPCWKKRPWSGSMPARRKQPIRIFLKT